MIQMAECSFLLNFGTSVKAHLVEKDRAYWARIEQSSNPASSWNRLLHRLSDNVGDDSNEYEMHVDGLRFECVNGCDGTLIPVRLVT